jgi:hypothetical protein
MTFNINLLLRTLIVSSAILFISTCGGGGGGGGSNSPLVLSWTPPSQNNDGSPLAVNELASYRIYYGINQSSLNDFIEIEPTQNMSSYIINNNGIGLLNNTNYFLAMTTVDNQGRESNFSEIINFNSQ